MRQWVLIGVLALAGCSENAGWNPNYTMAQTPYGDYQRAREEALVKGTPAPAQMPRARPFTAPAPQRPNVRVTAPRAAVETPPSLKQYAALTRHPPGTRLYARPTGDDARAARACRGFATAGAAQLAFLGQGGPAHDPAGMDPDGDGYVCGWDPRLHRRQPAP